MEHIGIDIHKRESQICILTPEGEIIERRIQSTRDRFTAVFAARARARVLLEADRKRMGDARGLVDRGRPELRAEYPERLRRFRPRDARMLAEALRVGTLVRRTGCAEPGAPLARVRDLLVPRRTIPLMRALVRRGAAGPGMPTGSAPTCRSSRFRPS